MAGYKSVTQVKEAMEDAGARHTSRHRIPRIERFVARYQSELHRRLVRMRKKSYRLTGIPRVLGHLRAMLRLSRSGAVTGRFTAWDPKAKRHHKGRWMLDAVRRVKG